MTIVTKSTKKEPKPKQTQDGRSVDELDERQLDNAAGGTSGSGAGKIPFNAFNVTRPNG